MSRALLFGVACFAIVALGACEFRPAGAVPDVDATTTPDAAPPTDAAPLPDATVVPAGYVRLDGTTSYYRANDTPAVFDTAARDCADDAPRATVAVIDDDAENEALRQLASAHDLRQVWLGIQDWNREGDWRTLAFEPLVYTAWLDGEPNDGGGNGEDCAVLLARFEPAFEEGRWNDIDCRRERAYVCEWR